MNTAFLSELIGIFISERAGLGRLFLRFSSREYQVQTSHLYYFRWIAILEHFIDYG